jgi:hypothetical protein
MAIEKYSGNRRALTHHPVMDDRLRYTLDLIGDVSSEGVAKINRAAFTK